MLQSAKLALEYTAGLTKEQFLGRREKQDSVVRRLEIIGEAARRVSEETRRQLPQLPWQDMVRMRNIMIHEYDDVDLSLVWDTVQIDLPALVSALQRIVPQKEK
jgi:uncharacterized protein with HEPN domain